MTASEAARIAAVLPLPKKRAGVAPTGFTRRYGNSIAKKTIEMEGEGKTIQEIGPIVAGAKGKVVYETGDMEHGIWSAGTVMGLNTAVAKYGKLPLKQVIAPAIKLARSGRM